MSTRGIYDRDGERIGYLEGTRVYNRDDEWIGTLRDSVIYTREGERRWRIDADAVLDLRGSVIGYLGEPAPTDD